MTRERLERMLAELDERNVDNVARTESYLELYAHTVASPPDLPWILMAHVVSRNAGYLMTDLAREIEHERSVFSRAALEETFLFLERANYLIFHDAWFHVMHHVLGRSGEVGERVPRFAREAWARYEAVARSHGERVPAELERALVGDLVTNEQNLIERRVVHNERFSRARAIVGFAEHTGGEAPIVLPRTEAKIRVGGFALLDRRIATGLRIFDEVLADRSKRNEIYRWALEHPHTGSRAAYGSTRPSPALRDAWPTERVRGLWPAVHGEPEHDPTWR